jgi:undecaprenyl diphosphate synthase
MQKIAVKIEREEIESKDITAEMISSSLDTHDIPDPELIIRTSGEFRTSNFLPWQSIYSEYFVTETLWPDFTPTELQTIIEKFNQRERRFGLTGDQIKQQDVA